MKRFLFIFILFSLLGCDYFETKKLSSDDIVQEEIKHIDWENLDTYPTFDSCDSFSSSSDKIKCFENEVSKHIFEVLAQHQVQLKDSVEEEILLKVKISSTGKPSLDDFSLSDDLNRQIPELEEWLEEAVQSLPKIYPAEKRGIPVSSDFKLPLIIKSE